LQEAVWLLAGGAIAIRWYSFSEFFSEGLLFEIIPFALLSIYRNWIFIGIFYPFWILVYLDTGNET
jgi:hypothetical protein